MSKATELAKKLFGDVKETVQTLMPGLEPQKVFNDLRVEGKRLFTQGAMELASALFNGSAFVPYGPGQYTPSGHGKESAGHISEVGEERQQVERSREGMSR